MTNGDQTRVGDGRRCGLNDGCGIRNDLQGFPQSSASVISGIAIELRYADGKPIYNQTAYIFSVEKDIDGNSKPNKELKTISTGEIGLLKADLPPGEYIILFDERGKIKGLKLSESDKRPGVDIKVEQNKVNNQKTVLGQVLFEIKDKNGKPSGNASACLSAIDTSRNNYEIDCEDANDTTGIIKIDTLPGDYTAKVQVGKTNSIFLFGRPETSPFTVSVKSGETDSTTCAIDFDKNVGTCNH